MEFEGKSFPDIIKTHWVLNIYNLFLKPIAFSFKIIEFNIYSVLLVVTSIYNIYIAHVGNCMWQSLIIERSIVPSRSFPLDSWSNGAYIYLYLKSSKKSYLLVKRMIMTSTFIKWVPWSSWLKSLFAKYTNNA